MAFLFRKNPKTPPDLVRALNEQLGKLEAGSDNKKYQEECGRFLRQIRLMIYGDDENEPQQEQIQHLEREIYSTDTLYHLVAALKALDFDSRKDVFILFLSLLRRQEGGASWGVDYLLKRRPETITLLLRAPEEYETALVSGQILRDCIKFEAINKFILESPLFWNYFRYVELPVFEVATDAFSTLHDLLTIHKKMLSEFLANNYDVFIYHANQLIQSKNYVTKRQSVRLLAELVLQRQNQVFLNKYFDDTTNLKLIMLLLSDKLKNLQYEAFHIFKFFIAKPKKSPKVLEVLTKNKDNFVTFFENFQIDNHQDANIVEERDYILNEIKKLPHIDRLR